MGFNITREPPILLEMIPRLIARLRETDARREDFITQYNQIKSGYEGERETDRQLMKTHLSGPVEVLTNVELQISHGNFIQIDTLIMTTSFIYMLEVKNIAGTLEFLTHPPRLQRTRDTGEINTFDCPSNQLEKNMVDFEVWLANNGLPLTITGAIILAYSKTQVLTPPEQMPIYYAKQLPQVVRKQESDTPIMSPEQLQFIARKIKNSNRSFNPFPLCTHFRINPVTLNRGLYCVHCHAVLLRQNRKTWICSNCKTQDGNPYLMNVRDYFALVNSHLSNKELRQFLCLKDKYAAHHILNNLPLNRIGQNRATKYCWPNPLQK